MKYLNLMRIKHYLKNFLIFLPIIFSKSLLEKEILLKAIFGFIAFSLSTSIIYIINDLKDIEKDKKHPIKKERPLASGKVSKKEAIILCMILSIVVIIELYLTNMLLSWGTILLAVYIFINILYSFGLKNIPLLDVAILSSGFVLRVLYGGLITSIPVSSWLFLTTLSIAFYMALGKRKNELLKLDNNSTREVLKYYTKEFLEKNMYMFLTLSIVFYSLWSTLGVSNESFRYSIVLVIIILMKYNMNIESGGYGDPIDVILNDKILIITAIMYGLACFGTLYIL